MNESELKAVVEIIQHYFSQQSGKPAEIVAKMVEGAMAKFRKENALLSQLFVIDNKTPISQVVEQAQHVRAALLDHVGQLTEDLGRKVLQSLAHLGRGGLDDCGRGPQVMDELFLLFPHGDTPIPTDSMARCCPFHTGSWAYVTERLPV